MTEIESALLHELRELERQVATIREQQAKPNLLPLFDRLDQLTRELPGDAPRDLRHFLERRSYEKARLYLEGRQAEIGRGSCGRGQ